MQPPEDPERVAVVGPHIAFSEFVRGGEMHGIGFAYLAPRHRAFRQGFWDRQGSGILTIGPTGFLKFATLNTDRIR